MLADAGDYNAKVEYAEMFASHLLLRRQRDA